jgi:hypothetical protein
MDCTGTGRANRVAIATWRSDCNDECTGQPGVCMNVAR